MAKNSMLKLTKTKRMTKYDESSLDRKYNGQKENDKRANLLMIYQIVHRKLKIEQHNQILTMGEGMCSGKVSSSCSTSGAGTEGKAYSL
jgi:hypothetical protein